MENEIKGNEYIRTKNGEIAKVIECRDEIVFDKEIKFHGMYRDYICEDELDFIVKHSPNLIDLIQCGDYVNGEQITDIWNGNRISSVKSNFNEEDIETIVTKEMMESISYKVIKM